GLYVLGLVRSAFTMNAKTAAYGRAALSGLLLALSFPQYGHPAGAWIALTPLIVALADGPSLGRAFFMGALTGVVFFTGTLYWITHVMATYGDMATYVAVLINAGLILYQGTFVAIFALVVRRLIIQYARRAVLAAPLVWVTIELGRTYVF